MEGTGRRELAELVTDPFLVDRDRYVLLTVVDAEGQADELRQDRRATAPDLDDIVTAGRTRVFCLLSREPSTNGPFQTERTMSGVPYFFRLWRLRRMNLLVDLLERVFLPLVGLPHGVTGWRPPEVRPSPPPCVW